MDFKEKILPEKKISIMFVLSLMFHNELLYGSPHKRVRLKKKNKKKLQRGRNRKKILCLLLLPGDFTRTYSYKGKYVGFVNLSRAIVDRLHIVVVSVVVLGGGLGPSRTVDVVAFTVCVSDFGSIFFLFLSLFLSLFLYSLSLSLCLSAISHCTNPLVPSLLTRACYNLYFD